MPLYTDGRNAVIVHFGRGDIFVGRAHLEGETVDDEIILAPQQPRAIGDGDPALIGKPSDTMGEYIVRLYFENTASLDVVIDELRTLRTGMAAGGPRGGA